jgi:two-component system sensor histidine kinase TctE
LTSPPRPPEHDAPSLRRRLLGLLFAPLLLLIGVALAIDYWVGVPQIHEAYDRELAAVAVAIAAQASADPSGRLALPPDAARRAAPGANPAERLWFRLAAADGTVLAGAADLPAPGGGDAVAFRDGRYDDVAVRLADVPASAAGRPVLVTVASTLRARQTAVRSLVATALATDGIVFAAVLLAVWVGVRGGLMPLLALREGFVARSASELEPLEVHTVPTEVQPLVVSLNAMFRRVREASAQQQRFLADAAHQLRTPLAGLSAQLDLMIGEPAAAPLSERLGSLRDALKRLAHTANQLLALSRAEAVALDPARIRRFELRPIVEDAVSRELDRALAKGLDLGADVADAQVRGEEWLVRELIGNLLDNALAYTPAGGTVTVRCGPTRTGAFLEVEDDGPGIAAEDLPRVTERFYRAAGSPGSGCGLGLAIVSDIARLHGGQLSLAPGRTGRGTLARVEFTN